MDEIERLQIGKKSEPLVGWEDQPKKGIGTNYPAMKVKGSDNIPPSGGLPWKYTPPPRDQLKDAYEIVGSIVALIVAIGLLMAAFWVAGKILGFW
jgi:hypothetical protein